MALILLLLPSGEWAGVRGFRVTAGDENTFDYRLKVLQYIVVANSQHSIAEAF
jgi:hypothetical protein